MEHQGSGVFAGEEHLGTERSFLIATDNDISVLIDTWGLTGDQNKEWTVEATGSRTITFQLGDMLPNTKYDLKVGGAKVSDATSDASGIITFPAYAGAFSEKIFETELSAPPDPSPLRMVTIAAEDRETIVCSEDRETIINAEDRMTIIGC